MNTDPTPRHQDLVAGHAISGIGATCALPSAKPRPSSSRHRKDVAAATTRTRQEPVSPILCPDFRRPLGFFPVGARLKSP